MTAEPGPVAAPWRELMRRGEVWAAYDLAAAAADRGETDEAAVDAVLCLARGAATAFALREYRRLGLHERADRAARALGARLLKDQALSSRGADRHNLACEAAAAYRAVHADFGGVHGLVNEAALHLAAGDRARSLSVAAEVLQHPSPFASASPLDHYYDAAARAEAHFLRGERHLAAERLDAAVAFGVDHPAAKASTLRQLRWAASLLKAPTDWLAPLRPRPVAHYTGRIFDEAARHRIELPARDMIDRLLADNRVSTLYGGLAAGSDLLWAESGLSAGLALHVILPVNIEAYRALSVLPYGETWTARFDDCLTRATSVRFSSKEDHLGDDVGLLYGSLYAMGCAAAEADLLGAEALQMILAGPGPRQMGDPGGFTERDAAVWSRSGRSQVRLELPALERPGTGPGPHPPGASLRALRAMLFIDAAGFGQLGDGSTPAFYDVVMGAIASTLERLPDRPEHVETWGDGLFLVFREPDHAANAALSLLETHAGLELTAHGLPASLGLRIGGHYGPVLLRKHPVSGAPAVVGAHVVAAARIEPDALPGSAYVSEAFAGALALRPATPYRCGYVGQSSARKEAAPRPLFGLSRA